MTALSAAAYSPQRDSVVEPNFTVVPVLSGAVLQIGSLAATNSAGYAVVPTATTGLRFHGVVFNNANAVPGTSVDNTGGTNGAISANVHRGIYKMDNYASDAVAVSDVGNVVYCVDDHTVSKTDGGGSESACGTLFDVDSTGAWVWVGKYNTTYANATRSTDGSMPAADKTRLDRLHWAASNLTDADASIAISSGTWRRLPTTVPLNTADRTLTVVSGGAVSGDQMVIERLDLGSYRLIVSNSSAGQLSVLPGPGQITLQMGTDWEVKSRSKGERRGNSVTALSSSAQSLAISGGTWIKIPALSANTTFTVVSGGAVSGDEILFTRQVSPSAHTVAISSGSGSGNTLCTLVASKTGFARIRFDGLDWELVDCGNATG